MGFDRVELDGPARAEQGQDVIGTSPRAIRLSNSAGAYSGKAYRHGERRAKTGSAPSPCPDVPRRADDGPNERAGDDNNDDAGHFIRYTSAAPPRRLPGIHFAAMSGGSTEHATGGLGLALPGVGVLHGRHPNPFTWRTWRPIKQRFRRLPWTLSTTAPGFLRPFIRCIKIDLDRGGRAFGWPF